MYSGQRKPSAQPCTSHNSSRSQVSELPFFPFPFYLSLHSLRPFCATKHTNTHTHTHTHTRLNGPMSGTTWVSRYRKGKTIWILLKQEAVSGGGISWAVCKSVPCSRQITTPAPHHSVFYRPDAFPAAQPTASKH